ncbi:MAG: DUF2127 domain-containing protein [Kofleriaceae bacterium]
MDQRRDRLIILIGIAKLVKALVLIAAAVCVFATLHNGVRDYLRELASGSGRESLTHAYASLTNQGPHTREVIGTGLLVYAALFTTEGVGLLYRRIWAEWLTIVITCSFIPLEIYEVIEKGSVAKAIVLVVNILIAIYLILRRVHAHHEGGMWGWLRRKLRR